jgi:hypothetical protein
MASARPRDHDPTDTGVDLCYLLPAVWPLVAAYLAIVLAGVVCLLLGRGTALLRGERVFRLTAAFVAIALAVSAVRHVRPPLGAAAFWAVSLAGSLLVRKRWILVHHNPRATAKLLETAMAMLLIPYERAGPRYTLQIGAHPAVVEVSRIGLGIALLTCAAHDGHKKMELLRALVAKRLRPVFPRPTIDLR